MRILILIWVLILFFLTANLVMAATSGTIRGTVFDPSGAVIPEASISIVNEGTNDTRVLKSDANGSFECLLLPVGDYTLRVEDPKFKTFVLHRIHLTVNQVGSFNVTLEVGSSESTVNVEANSVIVDNSSTQVGTVVDTRPIRDLPLNGRNLYQLMVLQPGVSVPHGGGGNPAVSGVGPAVFSSGGGRLTMNNFMVDGGDTNGTYANEATIELIPDAVEEFRVLTSSFNAEFGRNAASVVNVVSKSGTNWWHGNAFEFFRNERLNARNFFEIDRAPFKLNQFGGTLGGPLRKDKTFLFGSFQSSLRRQGSSGSLRRVFSDAERSGDFSARNPGGFTGSLTDPMCFPTDGKDASNCYPAGTSYDTIFPGAVIPPSFFSPVSRNIITNFIPTANTGGSYLVVTPVQPNNDYRWTLKLDHNLGQSHKLAGFYYFDDVMANNFSVSPSSLPGFPVVSAVRYQQFNLSDTWIISPNTLNESRLGFLRKGGGKENNPGRPISVASLGFTGITPGEPLELQTMPAINIQGGPVFQDPLTGSGGGKDFQNNFQFTDNFSMIKGKHTLKFGGDLRRLRYNQMLVYSFNGNFSFGEGGPNSTGDPFANFVLGLPTTYLQGVVSNQRLSSTQVNLYGQDSWKIASNLTLNYGLRWELTAPWVERDNLFQVFRFPSGTGLPPPQSHVFPTAPPGYLFPEDPGVPRGLTQTYYRGFGPRVGLAYSPDWLGSNKTVVRAAFGMFYNPVEQFVLLQFNGNPPYGASTFITAPGFANPFIDQSGNQYPSPYPFKLPTPGQTVDFNQFYPILMYGQFLPDQRAQYMAQYNLMLEYQLSGSTLLAAGYVGSQGHRLLANYDMNPGNPELCLQLASQGCGPFGEDSNYTGPDSETIFGTRPAGAFSNNGELEAVSNIFAQHTVANSNYHSLQARVERRATSLQFLASYTFSKSIDNASGSQNLLNPYCFSCDRTLSGFDVRHRFVFSYTYRIPFKKSASSNVILSKVLDGWEIGGITTFQSGIPVRLVDNGSDNSLVGGYNYEAADRPDVVGPVRIQDPRRDGSAGPNQFFDPSSFAVEPLGRIGNASHHLFAGPGINNWDFTLIKRTNFKERYQVEFRSEFFNFFNHAQFYSPVGDISTEDMFGRVFSAADPRFIQFGIKLQF